MNVGNLLNGGDSIGSYPWGYIPANYPSGGYPDPRFGYDRNSNHSSFSHLMVCWLLHMTSLPLFCLHIVKRMCVLFSSSSLLGLGIFFLSNYWLQLFYLTESTQLTRSTKF